MAILKRKIVYKLYLSHLHQGKPTFVIAGVDLTSPPTITDPFKLAWIK